MFFHLGLQNSPRHRIYTHPDQKMSLKKNWPSVNTKKFVALLFGLVGRKYLKEAGKGDGGGSGDHSNGSNELSTI